MRTFLFWLASFTWGCLMSLWGFIVALVLLISGYRPKRFHFFLQFEVGEYWGGFECGPIFVTDKTSTERIKRHEAGHGIQNIILGPLMPFLISIPSAVRYWYRRISLKTGKKKPFELPPYDSIWFEKWATDLGERYFSK